MLTERREKEWKVKVVNFSMKGDRRSMASQHRFSSVQFPKRGGGGVFRPEQSPLPLLGHFREGKRKVNMLHFFGKLRKVTNFLMKVLLWCPKVEQTLSIFTMKQKSRHQRETAAAARAWERITRWKAIASSSWEETWRKYWRSSKSG